MAASLHPAAPDHLPAFIAALPMAVLGMTYANAQLPFIVIGSLIPVLAWRLAADVALERAHKLRWLARRGR